MIIYTRLTGTGLSRWWNWTRRKKVKGNTPLKKMANHQHKHKLTDANSAVLAEG